MRIYVSVEPFAKESEYFVGVAHEAQTGMKVEHDYGGCSVSEWYVMEQTVSSLRRLYPDDVIVY